MFAESDEQVPILLVQKVNQKGVPETKDYLDLLCEYWHLSLSQKLSEEKAERLEYLLDLAESDTLLSTLFSEANYFVLQEIGLLNKEALLHYRKFQNELEADLNSNKELIDWDEELKAKYPETQSVDKNCFTSFASLLQQRLKFKGYYGGPIDGYFGPISEDALKNFQCKQVFHQSSPSSKDDTTIGVQFGPTTLLALLR